MSTEQARAFIEKVSGDSSLQAILRTADPSSDELAAIAKAAGYDFSPADLTMLTADELSADAAVWREFLERFAPAPATGADALELSDEQLTGLAGGLPDTFSGSDDEDS